jgi:hypothetical protein
MVVGTLVIPEFIHRSGFEIVDKLKILGFDITKKFQDLSNNMRKAIVKIESLIKFWSRFKLSISGRVTMAKSLLVLQLNYFGSIIPLDVEILSDCQKKKINNFIKGTLKISDELITAEISKGGLGFFDLKNFLISLQCSWVKRAYQNSIDNWRLELRAAAKGNCTLISPDLFDRDKNPIFHALAISFYNFKTEYLYREDNFLHSVVLGNPLVAAGGEGGGAGPIPVLVLMQPIIPPVNNDGHYFNWEFWKENGEIDMEVIGNLKIKDFIGPNSDVKSVQEISRIGKI